tara:strand:+ start:173 stop:517 length:345 start_codon:yes stop_codon:yes gene_type:complete
MGFMRRLNHHNHYNIGKRLRHGVNQIGKRLQHVNHQVDKALNDADVIARKVGNTLEKATPYVDTGLAALSLVAPEIGVPLAAGFMGAKNGIKTGRQNIQTAQSAKAAMTGGPRL